MDVLIEFGHIQWVALFSVHADNVRNVVHEVVSQGHHEPASQEACEEAPMLVPP